MGVSIWEGNKAQGLVDVGHLVVEGISRQNLLLSQMIDVGEATPAAELAEIHHIVQSGEAPRIFGIGEQLMLNYNDGTNDYVLPWDIVAFKDVQLQDGDTVPGMVLQSHYAMQGVQFDASEAAAVFPEGLAAGNYYFGIGTNWGTHCVSGKTYQFTTTVDIPAGGCIVIGSDTSFYTWGAPDTAVSKWRVYTFASLSSVTPLETLTIEEGATGTSIGTLSSSTKYGAEGANDLQRCAYGYNRYSQSAMRQWLNSRAAADAWWQPKNTFDRPPSQLANIRGFMAGFDEAFLSILRPVKVRTALNTTSDSEIGTYEDTFDTFFPSSLEEEYISPQLANVEGPYWPYWKERLGLSSPQGTGSGNANPMHIRYGYNAKTTAQTVRLRSAGRGNAYPVWIVYSSGHASSSNATYANRPAPACVIC